MTEMTRAKDPRRTAHRAVLAAAGLGCFTVVLLTARGPQPTASTPYPLPDSLRGQSGYERKGVHDASNIRTFFYNYGMVGDYPKNPQTVDLSTFHSVETPKGTGMNYSDGITPFVLAKIRQRSGIEAYIMETGYRERQGSSPQYNRDMRFEPRPGYFQSDSLRNAALSPAVSTDSLTWPDSWCDKMSDPDDPGWPGSWNGYFGKRPAADQESFTCMDDQYYDAWDFRPDSRDSTRRGLGLRVEIRGFQWSNPQAGNVIFWHYDITNEGTTDYNENIIFGLYMDSGVGGSALSCDGIYESDDDNAYYNKRFDENVVNLVYTWDKRGRGIDLSGPCARTGYLGYAYLETPGKPLDGIDNDEDGITDEKRDGGVGELITGRDQIISYINSHYDTARFIAEYGHIERRAAYRAGFWWTGDEDLDWNSEIHDAGADGIFGTNDTGEHDGKPTFGETNFDKTDLHESDQIGLTGFKMNRIRAGQDNPNQEVDNVLFFTNPQNWPERLFQRFSDPIESARYDTALVANYNIGFLFASGPFTLLAGKTERFSLALAYGGDLDELRRTVRTVQQIYNANYQFAVPPPRPTVTAESGDRYVRLSWDDVAERGIDPVTLEYDFEGYRVYRSTDPTFRDPRVITTGTGSGPIGNGRPIAQFDLVNSKRGFSTQTVEGVAYYLGQDTGIRHTWTDSTVTTGQEYYYAVTSYDYGSDSLGFYPSENAITVTRTTRGGIILPPNVVAVRPEPPVLGYVPAAASDAVHAAGRGTGTVDIEVVNSNIVPDGHAFEIRFTVPAEDSIRASGYAFTDTTSGRLLFKTGRDLEGQGTGPVAAGLLPVISTQREVTVDTTRTGFVPGSPTTTRLKAAYQGGGILLPVNMRRPGYPENLTIEFSDAVLDTSVNIFPDRARPTKFRVIANTPAGDRQLDFAFRDTNGDSTLSKTDERIDIVTYAPSDPTTPKATWRIQIDALGTRPGAGDVYKLYLLMPFSADDVFHFTASGERIDAERARQQAPMHPYVVPNPYVAAASFEPERYAVSGRGERRIEFRGLPRSCTVRIYTVRGDLVQTLRHDGSDDGYVPWDLRTKDNLDVAPGLYIFHVDGGKLGDYIGKFAIIK
jgi:hypothetical protein